MAATVPTRTLPRTRAPLAPPVGLVLAAAATVLPVDGEEEAVLGADVVGSVVAAVLLTLLAHIRC